MSRRPRARMPKTYRLLLIAVVATWALPGSASAEKVISQGDEWQVFTDGRVGSFFSWVHGDGAPTADPNVMIQGHNESIIGGSWPIPQEPHSGSGPGTVNMMRLRSGFLGNLVALGVRGKVTQWTTVTGYVQVWAYIESDQRDKSQPNYLDARQGYLKLEGPWGSLLAGRTRTLFSRGATDIDVLYAHKWGVGFPNTVDRKGPTLGMVGFGVMGSGFGAGMIYGTPLLGGLQLNVGICDPAALGGPGWNGTKYVRPEAELTFEKNLGQLGKLVLFADGVYQKVYKPGQCTPTSDNPCEETVEGVGYGGRLELGPFHLGVAGFYGKGLGLSYALENSYAAADMDTYLRWSDGYYAQTQLVLGRFDFFAGAGIVRLFLTALDQTQPWNSSVKYQTGANAGIVYNMTPYIHWDLEYFRAEDKWFLGEQQVLNCGAFGVTFNW